MQLDDLGTGKNLAAMAAKCIMSTAPNAKLGAITTLPAWTAARAETR